MVSAIDSASQLGGWYDVALLADRSGNIATSTAEAKGTGSVERAISSRAIDLESRVCSPEAEKAVVYRRPEC